MGKITDAIGGAMTVAGVASDIASANVLGIISKGLKLIDSLAHPTCETRAVAPGQSYKF